MKLVQKSATYTRVITVIAHLNRLAGQSIRVTITQNTIIEHHLPSSGNHFSFSDDSAKGHRICCYNLLAFHITRSDLIVFLCQLLYITCNGFFTT